MPCYSPLKGFRDAETGGWRSKATGCEDHMEVACGQCLGCRLDRSRMWAARIVHEASLHESGRGNCFITLTYRDKLECNWYQREMKWHVPDDWSLKKEHFQKFMKRLRRKLGSDIKFFHCGEYGNTCMHGYPVDMGYCAFCTLGRPHYHAVLFNCMFSDLEVYTQVNGENRYTSPMLEDIWKYGFVDVGKVNFESAAYVARYALKKVTGVAADEHYFDCENGDFKEPEYCTMSRGGSEKGSHGIGYEWYEKFKGDLFPSDEVPIPGSGVFKGMPRYYEGLFMEEDPVSMEEVKELRQEYRRENAAEYTPERLMDKYKVKKAQIDLLKRTL